MSLIRKLLLFIAFTNLLLLLATYLVSSRIILDNINKLEKERAVLNVKRAHNVLLSELSYIVKQNQGYAGWDDTYKFIQDQNSTYKESNLLNETLIGLDLSLIAYYSTSGQLLFIKSMDLNLGMESQVSKEVLSTLNDPVLQKVAISASPGEGPQGIYGSNDYPTLLSFEPILKSSKEGPPMGVLVMGRYLDLTKIKELSKKAELDISILPANEKTQSSLKGSEILVDTESPTRISVYTRIANVYKKPSEILKITSSRDFFSESTKYIEFLILGLAAVGLLSIILGSIIGSRIFLKPIKTLNEDISNVIKAQNPQLRVKEGGEYEIRTISTKINEMLSALEKSTLNLQGVNQALKEKAAELEKFNKFMINRELRMIELKKRIEELEKEQK